MLSFLLSRLMAQLVVSVSAEVVAMFCVVISANTRSSLSVSELSE